MSCIGKKKKHTMTFDNTPGKECMIDGNAEIVKYDPELAKRHMAYDDERTGKTRPLMRPTERFKGNKFQKAPLKSSKKWIFRILIICIGVAILVGIIVATSAILNHSQHLQIMHDTKLGQMETNYDEQMNLIQNLSRIVTLQKQNIEDHSKLIEMSKGLRYLSRWDLPDSSDEDNNQCSYISASLRFDCHPEEGASKSSCEQRGCCWNPNTKEGKLLPKEQEVPLDVPYCYYPKDWRLYSYDSLNKDQSDFSGVLKLERESFYGNDLPLVKIEATGIEESILRVKIFDPKNERYEPPFPERPDSKPFKKVLKNPEFDFQFDGTLPGFKVLRTSDKRKIFNSIGFGGFIFADQFLQISSILPSGNIYGLGEHRTNLKLNTNWERFTMFNRDQPPVEKANLYGSHPFYMVIEKSGKAHGVLFLNSNAMDIILQPTPAITFRSIGGIFDIYFFMGPSPADVLKQYSEIVGKPFLPPYWSLGFHLCRFGYRTLEDTKAVWQRTRDAKIPFDTQWNDLDYMNENNDFTYDKVKYKDLPDFINELHSIGMHYIPLIDAGISAVDENGTYIPYVEGVRRNVFLKDENGAPFKGKVWNKNSTTWPDFTNPNTTEYYKDMMMNMHTEFAFDGAWIDMNEPSNFYDGHSYGCQMSKLDHPKYMPHVTGGILSSKTVCMNAKHYRGYHYDLHNTYGTSQAAITHSALMSVRNKRPFIISRSTWEGHGRYAGHWTGDVSSAWHDLRMSIPEILAYSLFQIPMVGADICGFNGNATKSLCNRWMQLGAFYPFSRNHNSDDTIAQDPVSMGELVVASSKKALEIRYYLLPYLYTLFYRAHQFGETVARPLFVEFVKDPLTYNIDTQFLWGSCLMIAPVLEDKATSVNVYLPRGTWYDYYSMTSMFSIGRNFKMSAPLDTIPLLIRGGCIMPAQGANVTTTMSRNNPFELIVALDASGKARGDFYWDDGDSIDSIQKKNYKHFMFSATKNQMNGTKISGNFNGPMRLGAIVILGVDENVQHVLFNDMEVQFHYNKTQLVLRVDVEEEGMNLDNFILLWSRTNMERPDWEKSFTTAPPNLKGAQKSSMSASATVFCATSLLLFAAALPHFVI